MPTEISTADARKLAAEARALADAATPPPWVHDAEREMIYGGDKGLTQVCAFHLSADEYPYLVKELDATKRLILGARTGVPALAAALSSLADQLDTTGQQLERLEKAHERVTSDLEKSWKELDAARAENAARDVAETLIARRDVDKEILLGKVGGLDENTPYWTDLMRRERDARMANDAAVVKYRAALAAPEPQAKASKP